MHYVIAIQITVQKFGNNRLDKGPFKYYVIKEVGGWGGQMMMFDDKVGGWGWLNDDVIQKYTRTNLCLCAQKKRLKFS